MIRAARTTLGILVLTGSLSMGGVAAALIAATPVPTTRVFPPAEATIAELALPYGAFDCEYAYHSDTDPLPEDAATIDGCVLDHYPHTQQRVWKPP